VRRLPIAILAVCGLAGCTLDPTYQRPALPVAAQFPSAGAAYQSDRAHQPATPSAIPAALIGWRQVFTDPRLQALIALSLQNNRNLRIAILNIGASQAQFVAERANLFPLIDATTTGTLEGYPSVNAEPLSAPPANSDSSHTTTYTYGANLGFTAFELDVFGAIRSKTRSQLQLYLSEIETQRSTEISLVAEVASDYIALLADQEQLTIAQQTLAAQTRSYAITNAMFENGTTTLLSLREAQTTVDTAKASIAQYTRQVAQDENALTLVVGAPIPADLPEGRDLVHQDIMADLPAGLPSSLLTQRPDIMAAEHTLLSANALIGAARAAFFPSITLTASGGVASNSLNELFTAGGETWLFEPTITLPIFTWQQNEANLDYAKVQKRIDIATYEQTIQTAFREVSDGLAARGTYLDQLAAQEELVAAYRDAYRIADLRFRAGADGYLTTLDTQQSLFSAEQTLVSLKEAQLQNLATLYKALGGGWYADTAPASAGPRAGQ
jgi:multidrug efflux system outer membrane protein